MLMISGKIVATDNLHTVVCLFLHTLEFYKISNRIWLICEILMHGIVLWTS